MDRIRIAQIGICHEHASGKINTLRRLPEVFEIVGVVDDRTTSRTPRRDDIDLAPYQGLRWMSLEEVLNDLGIEAVTVEVPNNDLVPVALRCMERGLAMHMDKPGGEDLALYKTLLDGCKERNLPFQMGFMFRGNPAFQFCIAAIRNKLIGEVFELEADMNHCYGGEPYQEYIGKFAGGIMYNLGCHLIDFVAAALGRPENVTPFLKSAPGYPAGKHTLRFPPQADRYEAQLLELARIIRGEIANPYTYEHDYLVHEVTLAAAGYNRWR